MIEIGISLSLKVEVRKKSFPSPGGFYLSKIKTLDSDELFRLVESKRRFYNLKGGYRSLFK